MKLRRIGGIALGGGCYALAMVLLHLHTDACIGCGKYFQETGAGAALPFIFFIVFCTVGSVLLIRVARVASLAALASVALLGGTVGEVTSYIWSGHNVVKLIEDTSFFYTLTGLVACALLIGAMDTNRQTQISDRVARDRVNEIMATIGGAIRLFLLYSFPFFFLGTISGIGIYTNGPFARFALSDLLFQFMQEGATNLAVFGFCVMAIVCLVVAIIWRYFRHRQTIAYLRQKGITDLDGNGRTDSFADKFLDDL
jgi:hypothetical protein